MPNTDRLVSLVVFFLWFEWRKQRMINGHYAPVKPVKFIQPSYSVAQKTTTDHIFSTLRPNPDPVTAESPGPRWLLGRSWWRRLWGRDPQETRQEQVQGKSTISVDTRLRMGWKKLKPNWYIGIAVYLIHYPNPNADEIFFFFLWFKVKRIPDSMIVVSFTDCSDS